MSCDFNKHEYYRKRKSNLLASGLCLRCTKFPSVLGTQECIFCRAQGTIRKKKNFEKKKASGICCDCQSAAMPGKLICINCSEKRKERRRQKVNSELCFQCEKPRVNGLYCSDHAITQQTYRKRAVKKLKDKVISAYGNKCSCCGETIFEFLQIDHIDGGGRKHRLETGFGSSFYKWLKRNNYPKGYQVLCANCNHAKGMYGKCPHQTTT